MYSCVFTCFRFAATLNMLCLLFWFVSIIQLLSMFPRIHFSPVCEFLVIVHTAKTSLLRCCLYRLGCPQQLRRQRLIVQQIEIRHINQHQSRLGIFVHSEMETRLVFDKVSALCMSLIRPNLACASIGNRKGPSPGSDK